MGKGKTVNKSENVYQDDKNKKILQKTTKNTQKMLENSDKMIYKHYLI